MTQTLSDPNASSSGFPVATPGFIHDLAPAFDRVPLIEVQARRSALFRSGDAFVGILDNPLAVSHQRWVEARAGDFVEWFLASPEDFGGWLKHQEQVVSALTTVAVQKVDAGAAAERGEEVSLARIGQDTSPVVRLVNSTIHDALKLGASDIHLEATPNGLDICYRIDGVLEPIGQAPGREVAEQAISRIKVLAELDIAECRVPQDGRFPVRYAGDRIDLRISIMPSIHGEDAVLRILDKRRLVPEGASLRLEGLGFAAGDLLRIRALATLPYGMLLVTGPTGSGKTTTLYAVLSEIHDGKDKIITIEDPVEYEIPGILQIPVNDKKGLTFARGLRSILRHDPDKIMIGEIRDAETAEIAVQSALTGHLVLSTVHANHVFDVFSRFAHMGIDPYSLTSALNGIWAQRLLRTVCAHCTEETSVTQGERDLFSLVQPANAYRFRKGKGCAACRGTGYLGRQAVAEILPLNDRLRTLIARRAPLEDIKGEARAQGTRSLREAALQLACEGRTTLEEVARVTVQD